MNVAGRLRLLFLERSIKFLFSVVVVFDVIELAKEAPAVSQERVGRFSVFGRDRGHQLTILDSLPDRLAH